MDVAGPEFQRLFLRKTRISNAHFRKFMIGSRRTPAQAGVQHETKDRKFKE
jgi:hypothetical protein